MSHHSSIEWLYDPYLGLEGATWNRWIGCTRESSGCSNCYIFRQPPLRMRQMRFDKVGRGGRTPILMMPDRVLYKPLTYRKPLLIFPNSLADIWHPAVPVERTAEIFAVMLLASRHIFITTTKRHRRQRNWLRSARFHRLVAEALERIIQGSPVRIAAAAIEAALAHLDATTAGEALRPLHNVWIGVTCEANENGERLRHLATTPAAVTWASCEPVTDPELDLRRQLCGCGCCRGEPAVAPVLGEPAGCLETACDSGFAPLRPPAWFVFGGESGPAARTTALDTGPAPGLRPLDLDHLDVLIGQARGLGAAVFVKQLGEPWARQVGANSKAGRDTSEWPDRLRIREYPVQLAERALRVDPGNELALAAFAGTRGREEL